MHSQVHKNSCKGDTLCGNKSLCTMRYRNRISVTQGLQMFIHDCFPHCKTMRVVYQIKNISHHLAYNVFMTNQAGQSAGDG